MGILFCIYFGVTNWFLLKQTFCYVVRGHVKQRLSIQLQTLIITFYLLSKNQHLNFVLIIVNTT